MRIAEVVRYGEALGRSVTSGQIRFLCDLVAKQPWAVRDPGELKKRRVNTEERVARELGQIALQLGVNVLLEPTLHARISD